MGVLEVRRYRILSCTWPVTARSHCVAIPFSRPPQSLLGSEGHARSLKPGGWWSACAPTSLLQYGGTSSFVTAPSGSLTSRKEAGQARDKLLPALSSSCEGLWVLLSCLGHDDDPVWRAGISGPGLSRKQTPWL